MRNSVVLSTVFVIFLTGCSSISRLSEYSTSAAKTLKKYEELGYTFDKACRDRCYLEQVRTLTLPGADCNCTKEETADSVTLILYNSLKGYFDGLVKLSAGGLTTYKTQALAKELKTGQFGDVSIDKAKVDAYAKLSTTLLKAFTDGYRSKKLKAFIEEANDPLQVLINALEVIFTSNLTGKINIHKARMQSIYFDFLNDSTASAYEKKKAIDEYNMQVNDADAQQKQIGSFVKGLRSIRNGHQKLYDNRNKIKAKEMKDMLAQYASELEDISSEFNKLKQK